MMMLMRYVSVVSDVFLGEGRRKYVVIADQVVSAKGTYWMVKTKTQNLLLQRTTANKDLNSTAYYVSCNISNNLNNSEAF